MKLHPITFAMAFAAGVAACGSEENAAGDAARTTTSQTVAAPPTKLVFANHFELDGGDVHVVFDRSEDGKSSTLLYRDGTQTLSFRGADVQSESTGAGLVVSVFLLRTIDTGSIAFSVLVPRVEVDASSPTGVATTGITTVHEFSVLPRQRPGQLDAYALTPLKGTASRVDRIGPAGR